VTVDERPRLVKEDWMPRLASPRQAGARLVLALLLAFGLVPSDLAVGPVQGANVCSPFEVGAPYRPTGTRVVRAWGDARCSKAVYELRVWLRIYRSTDGGKTFSKWADGPWDSQGIPPHCNACSYKAATLSKSCSGTAYYFNRVYVNYFDFGATDWVIGQYKQSSTRQITC
jgi:hypothetical protein